MDYVLAQVTPDVEQFNQFVKYGPWWSMAAIIVIAFITFCKSVLTILFNQDLMPNGKMKGLFSRLATSAADTHEKLAANSDVSLAILQKMSEQDAQVKVMLTSFENGFKELLQHEQHERTRTAMVKAGHLFLEGLRELGVNTGPYHERLDEIMKKLTC